MRYVELQNGIIQIHIITMPLFFSHFFSFCLFTAFFLLFYIYYTTCWLEIALGVLNCVLHHYIHIFILKSRPGFQISIQHSCGIIWWRVKYDQYVDRKFLITCIVWYVTYAVFLCIEIAHHLQGLNTMTIWMLETQTGPVKNVLNPHFYSIISLMMMYFMVVYMSFTVTIIYLPQNTSRLKYSTLLI